MKTIKNTTSVVVALVTLTTAAPVYAQLGGLSGALSKARDAKSAFDDLNITDAEERQIGESVSGMIRTRFGVVQNAAVHKYVTLVGATVASGSSRPTLAWTFVVLDTDGVNAFASPGGFVHITRGALALIRNEAELASVLAHEIAHVTEKHAVNAIKKNKSVQVGSSQTLSSRAPFLDSFANRAYEMILENNFDRDDELNADKVALGLAAKAGYAAGSLADFLTRLDERNKDQTEKNGLFASHPETQERIDRIKKGAAARPTAIVEARYTSTIKYQSTPITAVAVAANEKGAAAPAPSTQASQEDEKKRGFGLGSLKPTVGSERQSQQVSASGGARGIGRDRAARGGDNPALVKVAVSAAELTAFKAGIV